MVPKPIAFWEVYVPIIPRASRRTALTLPLSEEEWGSAHLVAAQDHLQNKAYQRKTSGKAMVFHWESSFFPRQVRLPSSNPSSFDTFWLPLEAAETSGYRTDEFEPCSLLHIWGGQNTNVPPGEAANTTGIIPYACEHNGHLFYVYIIIYNYTYIFLYLSTDCFIGLCNDIHIMECISLCPWSNTHAITFGHQLPVEAFCQLHQPTVFHWSVELLPGKFKPSRTGRF